MLIGAVPPLMLETAANPGGLPMEVFDQIRLPVLPIGRFSKIISGRLWRQPAGREGHAGFGDSFWLQGMLAGFKSVLDCVKAFSETDTRKDEVNADRLAFLKA